MLSRLWPRIALSSVKPRCFCYCWFYWWFVAGCWRLAATVVVLVNAVDSSHRCSFSTWPQYIIFSELALNGGYFVSGLVVPQFRFVWRFFVATVGTNGAIVVVVKYIQICYAASQYSGVTNITSVLDYNYLLTFTFFLVQRHNFESAQYRSKLFVNFRESLFTVLIWPYFWTAFFGKQKYIFQFLLIKAAGNLPLLWLTSAKSSLTSICFRIRFNF